MGALTTKGTVSQPARATQSITRDLLTATNGKPVTAVKDETLTFHPCWLQPAKGPIVRLTIDRGSDTDHLAEGDAAA